MSARSCDSSVAAVEALSDAPRMRHHRDQPEPDRERHGGRGRPSRVPHRVLPPDPGMHAEALDRRADRARDRARDQRRQHRDRDEGHGGAQAHQRGGVRGLREQPDQEQPDARSQGDRARDEPPPRVAAIAEDDSWSAWIGATRAACRAGTTAATTVTTSPTTSATTSVRGLSCSDVDGRSIPAAPSSARSPAGDADPDDHTDHGCEQTDDRGLGDHRHHHLTSRRAERPQQRKLARALRHDDRERVEDDERADEQRDRREHQEHDPEEPEPLLQRLRLLVRDGRAGDDLDLGAHDLLDLLLHGRDRRALGRRAPKRSRPRPPCRARAVPLRGRRRPASRRRGCRSRRSPRCRRS